MPQFKELHRGVDGAAPAGKSQSFARYRNVFGVQRAKILGSSATASGPAIANGLMSDSRGVHRRRLLVDGSRSDWGGNILGISGSCPGRQYPISYSNDELESADI